jgi:hypothetical protein
VVGEADAGLGDPAHRRVAAGHCRDVPGVLLEHGTDLLLDAKARRAPGVLDLAEARRQIVRGGVAPDQHELVQGLGAGVREHRLFGVFGRRVHETQRVGRPGAARRGVRSMRRRDQALVDPLLRLDGLEGEDPTPIGAALGIAERSAGEMRVIGDERMKASAANWIAPPDSSNFSVSVRLPAGKCERIAKVRRREISTVSVSISPL